MKNKQSLAGYSGKILIICGPTATGKTNLAIKIAKKFNGEIVSADSRQVYRDLDIGTGKDIPPGTKIKYPWFGKYGYYEIDGIKIWGYDLVSPKEEFSVSHYIKIGNKLIENILKQKKLPIVVGGTGFYIKGLVDGIETAEIPQNTLLRQSLERKDAEELFEMLAELDSVKAASLNSSDQKNPRRLMRAIEVAQYRLIKKDATTSYSGGKYDALFIGLTAPKETLDKNIEKRVEDRIIKGAKNEVKNLLSKGVTWDYPSMKSLGYGEWRDYFEGGVEESVVISEWKKEERKYSKRQITWFKKDRRINWCDIENEDYAKKVESMIIKWHNT